MCTFFFASDTVFRRTVLNTPSFILLRFFFFFFNRIIQGSRWLKCFVKHTSSARHRYRGDRYLLRYCYSLKIVYLTKSSACKGCVRVPGISNPRADASDRLDRRSIPRAKKFFSFARSPRCRVSVPRVRILYLRSFILRSQLLSSLALCFYRYAHMIGICVCICV